VPSIVASPDRLVDSERKGQNQIGLTPEQIVTPLIKGLEGLLQIGPVLVVWFGLFIC
jgi:hypothetical protein